MNLHPVFLRRPVAVLGLLVLSLLTIRTGAAAPENVGLVSFKATASPGQILLEWETATEYNVAGFCVRRSSQAAPGDFTQIACVPSLGDLVTEASYRVADTDVEQTVRYDYWLEVVNSDGTTEDLASVSAVAPTTFNCETVGEIPREECEALVKLYEATSGSDWTHRDGWLATQTPCSWYGVTCKLGHVREINLPCNRVSGMIPSELGRLARLQVLNLAGGELVFLDSGVAEITECAGPHLSGSIPRELGSLAYLQQLNLAANALSGVIPPELGNLTYLQRLSLSGNTFSGVIPPELGRLAFLQQLDLISSGLSGRIPSQLGYLPNLQRLDLRGNRLVGWIPRELSSLVNLHWLDLSHNELTGAIPPELGRPALLYRLDLSSNQLSGLIPSALSAPVDLQWLHLNNNQLSGALPRSLMNLDLSGFDYENTRLCEPSDAAFQAWLAGIASLARTGVACKQTIMPLVFAQPAVTAPFWADQYVLEPGECTTLHWDVQDVQAVYLNGQPVAGHGAQMVCPAETTMYVLEVIDMGGSLQEFYLTITVLGGDPWAPTAAPGLPQPPTAAPPATQAPPSPSPYPGNTAGAREKTPEPASPPDALS